MSETPCRITQWSCIALVVLAVAPWALLTAGLVYRAVNSSQPLTSTLVAWMVLLVPLWVFWFAAAAWEQRHESAMPALVMAAPAPLVTALFFLVPAGT